MSYGSPVGYLGSNGGSEAAVLAAIGNQANELWAESQRLAEAASEIARADSFSDRALDAALELAQRAARAAGSNVQLDRSQYVSLVQASVAQLAGMAVTLKRLAMSQRDVMEAHQAANAVYGAGFRLAQATRQLMSSARGGTSMAGLGLIHMVAGPIIILSVAIYVAWYRGYNDAEAESRRAVRVAEIASRMPPDQRRAFLASHREALASEAGPSVAGLMERVVEEGGATARSWNDRIGDLFEKPLMIVAGIGTVALVGAGLYAAWPYLTGVRSFGETVAGGD